MKIGVLSDTHIPRKAIALPAELLRDFQGVDMILHAGDLISLSVLRELQAIAPTFAVRGNVDPPEVADVLPRQRIVEAGKFRIGLVHGDYGNGATTPRRAQDAFVGEAVDCIVFGHSHQPYNQVHNKILLFNPGSPTDRRWEPRKSYGFLHLNDDIQGEIRYL